MKPIKDEELRYEYNTRGYMLYYRDKPIGGAGVSKTSRGCKGNLKLNKDTGELVKRNILNGRIDKFMLDVILKIQAEQE